MTFKTTSIYFRIICLMLHGILFSLSAHENNFHHQLPQCMVTPETVEDLAMLVRQSVSEHKKISILGAGKSQGQQTASFDKNAVQINMAKCNQLIDLNEEKKEVTIQAGARWTHLITYLAHYSLAVMGMQSYSDFSIGGSLSVNAHGRDFQAAPLIKTVKSFHLMQTDGSIINVSRDENQELFKLVIGGYGLFGIIIDVTLYVTDDIMLHRKTLSIPSTELANNFEIHIKNNQKAALYSARFSIGQNNLLDDVLMIWYEKPEIPIQSYALQFKPQNKFRNYVAKTAFNVLESSPLLKNMRYSLESFIFSLPEFVSRNNFMNESLDGLPEDSKKTSYILQEYFIPYHALHHFLGELKAVTKKHKINVLNVTARHINQDDESCLSFAPEERCSLVLYIALKNSEHAFQKAAVWTRELIDAALKLNGTYYLPYHLFATNEQLQKAYPSFAKFLELKKKYDPAEIFSNSLYEQYRSIQV